MFGYKVKKKQFLFKNKLEIFTIIMTLTIKNLDHLKVFHGLNIYQNYKVMKLYELYIFIYIYIY